MRRLLRKSYIVILCILLGICFVKPNVVYADDSFWVKYIDVGQGDATLVQCNGHYLLIDGGPADSSSKMYSLLSKSKIKKIDYIIATHPDADHIGGLSGALNYAKVDICFSSVSEHDTKTFKSLKKYLKKQGVNINVPKSNISFNLESAKVELFITNSSVDDTNNDSIITKITYGDNSFIFMGDAGKEEEKELISEKYSLACDVIKVGHHGSRDATSRELLKNAKPKYAVISVGEQNAYGHPTKETLYRLKSQNIILYRTDVNGDILCSSDGKELSFIVDKNASDEVLWSTQSINNDASSNNTVISSKEVKVPEGTTFVLNTNTKKFHLPKCQSVYEIKDKNRKCVSLTRNEIIEQGYSPCNSCKP